MKRFEVSQLLLIVLISVTFTACDKDKATIMAYGYEHEIISARNLTLNIKKTYVYTTPWWFGDNTYKIPCFEGVEEKTGERFLFCEGEIEGFTYIEGIESLILVREYQIADPPADASDRVYKLIKKLN